jgi:hypothetical protein
MIAWVIMVPLILEHQVEDLTFYTLYGHLSLNSIDKIKIGQQFKKRETIATLGMLQ